MARPALPDPSLGVFETLLVAGGEPVALDAHLERLRTSAGTLYGAGLPDAAAALVADAAAGLELGRLRLNAVPRDAADAFDARARDRARTGQVALDVVTAAIDRAVVCPPWERGLALRAVEVDGWTGGHKWVDRRLLEALDAEAAPAAALLAAPTGELLETTRANLFVVRADGVVATPPADGRILPGVARAAAIAALRAAGVEVVETSVDRDDVSSAREAFTTGSVRLVEPVRALDGVAAGDATGPLTVEVADRLLRDWLGEGAAAR